MLLSESSPKYICIFYIWENAGLESIHPSTFHLLIQDSLGVEFGGYTGADGVFTRICNEALTPGRASSYSPLQ